MKVDFSRLLVCIAGGATVCGLIAQLDDTKAAILGGLIGAVFAFFQEIKDNAY